MITTKYLQEIAAYTDRRIAKVTLNGSYDITTFTVKKVSTSTIELEYMIKAADINAVSLLQLKASNGDIISSNEVYIPVIADTVIKQFIEVKGV